MIVNSTKCICYVTMAIIFIIILIGCNSTRPVTESEAKEIEVFLNSFYDFLDTPTELESGKKWFLNDEIHFYLSNNNTQTVSSLDFSEKDFHSLITAIFTKYGKREQKELVGMYFTKTADEMPVKDLFVVKYRVKYEGVEANERFLIKKDGTQYKVFRYAFTFHSEDDWEWRNLLE